ncbi:MAG: thiamine pyrophosphate-binding protein [Phycisphaerae bacterium]
MPTESQQSQMRTGSRVVIDALEQAGVSVAFGYPGGAIMPLYDELLNVRQARAHAARTGCDPRSRRFPAGDRQSWCLHRDVGPVRRTW